MKRIKALLLAGIITASCFAGTFTASAETATDDAAYIYVTDVNSENTEDYPVPETPAEPALTANVGDIIEVTVTAKATTDVKDFAFFWLMTYFGQSEPGAHEILVNNPLIYTDKYYGNGAFEQHTSFDNTLSAIYPETYKESLECSHYGYSLSSFGNYSNLSESVDLYKFTLRVRKGGKMFINTTNHEAGYWNKVPETIDDPNLIDVKTTVAIVGSVEEVIGDANGDGELNAKDRMVLTRYLAKWVGYEDIIYTSAADVNKDSELNAKDRMILTRHLAKWTGYETLPYTK